MLMLKGHPGCGKSTLAAQLARQLSWPLVDKDDARDCLTALPHDAAALNAVAYAIMFQVAARQLQCGQSVIVDSPLSREETWQEACRLAGQVYGHSDLVHILGQCRRQTDMEHRGT